MKLTRLSHILEGAQGAALVASLPASDAKPSRVLTVLGSRGALTVALLGIASMVASMHGVAAADTGTPDTFTLDSGAFNGVVSGTGTYLNNLIKNFGVPAILVSLAVSGWAFVRHIAKGAFH